MQGELEDDSTKMLFGLVPQLFDCQELRKEESLTLQDSDKDSDKVPIAPVLHICYGYTPPPPVTRKCQKIILVEYADQSINKCLNFKVDSDTVVLFVLLAPLGRCFWSFLYVLTLLDKRVKYIMPVGRNCGSESRTASYLCWTSS